MRIVSIAIGTHGDVRPIIALGRALKAHGADVCIVTGDEQIALVERNGLEAASAGVDFTQILGSSLGFTMVESGNGASFLALTRNMKRLLEQHNPTLMEASYRAAAGADAVISGFTSDLFAVSIAEKLGVPHVSAQLTPAPVATRDGDAMVMPPRPGRASLANLLFHRAMVEPFNWRMAHDTVNAFRTERLGLPAQRRRDYQKRLEQALIVQGFSNRVVPHPQDWPDTIHTAGYWFLDDDHEQEAPQELRDFLDAGEPPVYFGFGSMTARNAAQVTRILADAAAAAGRRALIQAGWARLGDGSLPAGSFVLSGPVSHQWLFPRVAAVVHHGGAGTTAAGLRAGRPTVIIPHFGDQPFWGARIAALGVGPRAIPWPKLTSDKLADAVRRAVEDPGIRDRAAALGAEIRAEDGIGTAVALIGTHLGLAAPAAPGVGRVETSAATAPVTTTATTATTA